jgi:crotonobetainyl-CoA:carnitine CoA-transferase CaiB-like acyl-CoA transferase
MDGVRLGTRLDIPKVGEHTREVLAGLGYDKATIDGYAQENFIFIK